MTFTDLVNEVADRLNLTSTTATTRIGRSINEKYRTVCSSIGLETSARTTVTATASAQSVTFSGVEKVWTVYTTDTPPVFLQEVTYDEIREAPIYSGNPARRWAVSRIGSNTVEVVLDLAPATPYVLKADGQQNQVTLSGTMVPAFPEDFHILLVYGAMAIEHFKMEKPDLAAADEAQYDKLLSELRFFLAKSSWLAMYQAKRVTPTVYLPQATSSV